MKNVKLFINIIVSILLFTYLLISNIVTNGRNWLYGSDKFVDYISMFLIVIAIFLTVYYGRSIYNLYKNGQRYRALLLFILTIMLLVFLGWPFML